MLKRIQDDCESTSILTGQQTCPDIQEFKLDLHLGFSCDSYYDSI